MLPNSSLRMLMALENLPVTARKLLGIFLTGPQTPGIVAKYAARKIFVAIIFGIVAGTIAKFVSIAMKQDCYMLKFKDFPRYVLKSFVAITYKTDMCREKGRSGGPSGFSFPAATGIIISSWLNLFADL